MLKNLQYVTDGLIIDCQKHRTEDSWSVIIYNPTTKEEIRHNWSSDKLATSLAFSFSGAPFK